MRVFQIKPDYAYSSLLPSNPRFFDIAGIFKPQPKASQWSEFGDEGPSFYARDPALRFGGNFFDVVAGALAFEASLRDGPVNSLLAQAGEILPARLEGFSSPISILNVLTVYNCFDLERSNFRKAGSIVVEIFEHVFLPEEIGEVGIFKAQVKQNTTIYTVADRGNPDLEFFHRYRSEGLTGLVFDEVWHD
jgi:hypothetical protein